MSHPSHPKHEGAAAAVSYATDIKPLFSTKTDIPHMAQHGIHLDQYQSTSDNATAIYGRLTQPPHSQQLMPPAPEGPWPAAKIALFKAWMDGGKQP